MEGFPKGRYKELVPVRDDLQGAAVLAVPFVKEEQGKIFCRDIGASGDNLYIGTTVVGHCNNAVVALVLREGANEIDRYGIAAVVWDGKWVKRPGPGSSPRFVGLALRAARDVGTFEITPHVWPVVRVPQGLVTFIETEVAKRVVSKSIKVFADGSSTGNNES
jgi:hypothetical protein